MSNRHDFTLDKEVINHIISKQSGNLINAVSELVMNSIDANAEKIEIEFNGDKNSITVSDNGKGFESKEEIINYFGRFGTPHKKGDATFGRFRIGRGQLFAYGKCSWRSSSYEMIVDIENCGLTYELHENLPHQKGCVVTCELYNENGFQYVNFYSLQNFFKYLSIEVFLNEELISQKTEKWDYECDNFCYKEVDSEEYGYDTITVYNQGIYTSNESEFGTNGILLSKKPLEVNFARNAIIKNKCDVWSSFYSWYSENEKKSISEKINSHKKIPKREVLKYLIAHNKEELSDIEILQAKIIHTVNGDALSLANIIKSDIKYIVKEDSDNAILSDTINENRECCVIQEYNYLFSGVREQQIEEIKSTSGFINYLFDVFFSLAHRLEHIRHFEYEGISKKEARFFISIFHGCNIYRERNEEIINRLKEISPDLIFDRLNKIIENSSPYFHNIKELTKIFPTHSKHVKISSLSASEKKAYQEIKKMADSIYENYVSFVNQNAERRKIKVGDSSSFVEAHTNGKDTITVDIKTLKKTLKDIKSIEKLFYILLHEYTHSENNLETNKHGLEFYKNFHDTLMRDRSENSWRKVKNAKEIVNTFAINMCSHFERTNEKMPTEFVKAKYGKKSMTDRKIKHIVNSFEVLVLKDISINNFAYKYRAYLDKSVNVEISLVNNEDFLVEVFTSSYWESDRIMLYSFTSNTKFNSFIISNIFLTKMIYKDLASIGILSERIHFRGNKINKSAIEDLKNKFYSDRKKITTNNDIHTMVSIVKEQKKEHSFKEENEFILFIITELLFKEGI